MPINCSCNIANKIHLNVLISPHIRFMYKTNNKGHNTEPWGTSQVIAIIVNVINLNILMIDSPGSSLTRSVLPLQFHTFLISSVVSHDQAYQMLFWDPGIPPLIIQYFLLWWMDGRTDKPSFFYNCFLFLFTGRREFVQRLKLEGTLNVHDGCVSKFQSVYSFYWFLSKKKKKVFMHRFVKRQCRQTAALWLQAMWLMPLRNLNLQQSHVLSLYQPGRLSVQNIKTTTAYICQERRASV